MADEIRDIHRAVIGDPKHGHRGVIKRLELVESKTEWLYAKITIAIGVGVIAWAWILKGT